MKYIVITIKSHIEIIFSELEMTCCNCKYGHLETDGKWHCWGEKKHQKYLLPIHVNLGGKMIRKILARFKECRHLCCFCKYHKQCDISWWKR